MEEIKVCLLCRVSTLKQDYEYQVGQLTDIARNRNWNIMRIFANKVSGAKKNEDRREIMEMLSTLEALKVIELLNEKKVCLYLANYSIETLNAKGEVNPTCHLICTLLLEIAQMERGMIRSRMAMGYAEYLNKRKTDKANYPLGRPSTYRKSDVEYREQYQKELSLLRKGISLRNVSRLTGTSVGTLQRLKKYL